MGKVVHPTFGKPCEDCGDQIDPRRVRIRPSVKLCRDCQTADEMSRQRQLQGARPNDIVILRSR